MATHDYVIANGTGAAVRSDLNDALAAIVSNNSSSSEPATTYAYQWWADTTANVLKIRNSANNAWITLRELDGTMLIEDGSASTPGLAFADDVNTGIFSPAADQIGFATGGVERLEIGSSEVVFNDPSNDVDFRVESNGQTHMLFVDAGNDRVGIGTASPAAAVHVVTSGAGSIRHADGVRAVEMGSDGSVSHIGSVTAGQDLALYAANGEKARIDSSGRLLVGTSSARSNFSAVDTPQLQIEGTTFDAATISVTSASSTSGGNIELASTGVGTVGSTGTVSNNGYLGSIHFLGGDGSNLRKGAAIDCQVDGTPGTNDMPGRLVFGTTADGASSPTERMRLTSDGKLGLRTSSPSTRFHLVGGDNDFITLGHGSRTGSWRIEHSGVDSQNLVFIQDNGTSAANSYLAGRDLHAFYTGNSERVRIDSSGNLLVGKTELNDTTSGLSVRVGGVIAYEATVASGASHCMMLNRQGDDGTLVLFRQANTNEGSISVSGSTVSYNGGHLARWSQLAGGAERTEILRGSVLSNLDEMCEWAHAAQDAVLYTAEDELPEGASVGDVKTPAVDAYTEDNEQLNRMKVSDVEGDPNVAGVFQAWDDGDDTHTNDFYCAMTGDFVIRIAQGTTVARGDLLMSAGDGTAKPQDDDIVRSKTIAKVISTTVSTTYSDGSYCVPCVLMAC